MKKINFECPTCGKDILIEMMDKVTLESVVEGISDDKCNLEYSESETDLGEVVHYECANCGDKLYDDNNQIINHWEKLIDWLRNNDMLEE